LIPLLFAVPLRFDRVRLGFTYTVKSANPHNSAHFGLAEDSQEELDSPETIDLIAGALRSLGHEVELLGDGEPLLRRLLDGPRPGLVFNIAEGVGVGRAREARVPAVLEMLGIPHTGSDPLTLAVALDKPLAKTVVAAAGVTVPRGVVVDGFESPKSQVPSPKSGGNASRRPGTWDLGPGTETLEQVAVDTTADQLAALRYPLLAKPAFEGSSKGVLNKCLIEDVERLEGTIEELLVAYRQPVLVEEFIDGDELTVGVVGNIAPAVIGVMRIVPLQNRRRFVYSLEVKRDWEDRVRYECPAEIPPAARAAVEQAALTAYRALGCRDVARIDFRLRDGVPYFIEANPLPGLSPKSGDLVLLAAAMGIDHPELLRRIIAAACERYELRMTNDQIRHGGYAGGATPMTKGH
jgi:D-alanine-D-alanine ligase